jgi:hypothetical protein
MTQADLERRLLALERHTAGRGTTGAVGLSSALGAASTNYRDHFPVILTSTFDSLTGYDWDRLILDRGDSLTSVVEVDEPQSGSYAVTIDNNEGLTVGTRGWLMVDPNAGGWILLVAGEPVGSSPCNTGCGSLVGLLEDSCTQLELVCASGEFAEMDADQFAGVYAFGVAGVWTFQVWDDGSEDWVDFELELFPGDTPLTPVVYTGATDTLTAGGVELKAMCFGESATFAGGPMRGFDGDAALRAELEECDSNDFVLKVSCSCCPMDGWQGPGFYCVAESDCDTDETSCVELLDGDECADGAEFVICSGPYSSQSECDAVCDPEPPVGGPITTSPCCDCVMSVLTLVVDNIVMGTGTCGVAAAAQWADPITLTYDAGGPFAIFGGSWSSAAEYASGPPGNEAKIHLWCDGVDWKIGFAVVTFSYISDSCDPFSVVADANSIVCEDGSGSYTATFTITGTTCTPP